MSSRLEYRVFRSSFDSWNSLFEQACAFANSVGRENVLNISHSCHNNDGVVTVWYWRKENTAQNFGINQFDFGE